MPRLFAGIELPEAIRDQLSDLAGPLPGAKWVDDDDLHITLRFAGDIEGRIARDFTDLLGEIDADVFELRLQDIGTFGGNDPRSIWAGIVAEPGSSTPWLAPATGPRATPACRRTASSSRRT